MSKRADLRALTGLRIVAALVVVLYHYAMFFAAPVSWGYLVTQGPLGVDFFFLLSGFILSYTYSDGDGNVRGTRRAFWIARIARIYPVYLIGLALGLVPFLEGHHGTMGIAVAAVLQPVLMQAWVAWVITPQWWNPPGWSLTCEAIFYLLFPALLPFLTRLSTRQLIGVLTLCLGLLILIPTTGNAAAALSGQQVSWWQDNILKYNPVLRLPEFVVGIDIAILWMRRDANLPFQVLVRAVPRDLAVLVVVVSLCLLASISLPHAFPLSAIMFPLLALLIPLLASGRGAVAQVLGSRPLVWLGEISYGVYILHWPLWWWMERAATHMLHLSVASPALLALYVVVLVAAAGASYQWIETPARRAIRARWSQPRRVAQGVRVLKLS
jgi:peptidoglycan/LPS O-acetylase OafA/YrhL